MRHLIFEQAQNMLWLLLSECTGIPIEENNEDAMKKNRVRFKRAIVQSFLGTEGGIPGKDHATHWPDFMDYVPRKGVSGGDPEVRCQCLIRVVVLTDLATGH